MAYPKKGWSVEKMLSRRGFTLIELLIVIAIILILIAIALPNFLEAQIRARVANAQGGMRNLKVAVESYAIDRNGIYPADGFELEQYWKELGNIITCHDVGASQRGCIPVWSQLTTPVAYITEIPSDPFASVDLGLPESDPNTWVFRYGAAMQRCEHSGNSEGSVMAFVNRGIKPYFVCEVEDSARGKIPVDYSDQPFDPEVGWVHKYFMLSPGPDLIDQELWHWTLNRGNYGRGEWLGMYAPTNGTKSMGDLMQWGP